VLENRVLRRIFGSKMVQMAGCWIQLHNKELHELYYLPNIIRMVKTRRMRWTVHVACLGEKIDADRILVGKRKERDY
jgi:hypothetical protein